MMYWGGLGGGLLADGGEENGSRAVAAVWEERDAARGAFGSRVRRKLERERARLGARREERRDHVVVLDGARGARRVQQDAAWRERGVEERGQQRGLACAARLSFSLVREGGRELVSRSRDEGARR